MKPSWKGTISFGLVDISVELYSAVIESSRAIPFKLLHAKCHTPIEYERWCSKCLKNVKWDEIEKGVKLRDGTYFVVTPDYIKTLKPHKTDSITIVKFVSSQVIDPVLFNTHYYVAPGKKQDQPFFLFAAALARLNKVAIGQFVLRDRQYVCVIQPYKSIMLLTTLNYAYEVRELPATVPEKLPLVSSQELKLAMQLIGSLSEKSFSIDRYKDSFATELIKKISALKKGIAIEKVKKVLKKPAQQSLMKALQQSLSQVQGRKKKSKKA